MIEIAPNNLCPFSNNTFRHIVDELNDEFRWLLQERETLRVMFTDGDTTLQPRVRPTSQVTWFIVMLVTDISRTPFLLHAGSDLVVSKKIRPEALKLELRWMLKPQRKKPGSPLNKRKVQKKDSWKNISSPSVTEQKVLSLLLEGCPPHEIAGKAGLSINAISRYRMLAVRRSGFRNFNELVIAHLKLQLP